MRQPNPDEPRWSSRAPHAGSMYGPVWRPLTVGALRRIIEGMDDEIHVVLSSEDWFDNVDCVYAPPPEGIPDDYVGTEWQCLTLFSGVSFDARQF